MRTDASRQTERQTDTHANIHTDHITPPGPIFTKSHVRPCGDEELGAPGGHRQRQVAVGGAEVALDSVHVGSAGRVGAGDDAEVVLVPRRGRRRRRHRQLVVVERRVEEAPRLLRHQREVVVTRSRLRLHVNQSHRRNFLSTKFIHTG